MIPRLRLGSVSFMPASAGRRGSCAKAAEPLSSSPENDAIERPAYSTNLALAYALTGESERAVTLIEQLLTKPAVEVQRGTGNDPDEPAELGDGIPCEAIHVSRKFSPRRSRKRVQKKVMAADSEGDSQLEIAHVLCTDIVGYSKLLTNEQREQQQELNRVVRGTEQFRAAETAGKLVRIPTGDGMVLAFLPPRMRRCVVRWRSAARYVARRICRCGWESIADRSTWLRT